MDKLITDFYEISILDFVNIGRYIYIDIKLESEMELKKFISFVNEHNYENELFDYEISGKKYHGHCGMYVYDKNLNSRLVMVIMSDDEYTKERYTPSIFLDNVKKVLNNQKNAIRELTEALKDKNIINDIDEQKILNILPTKDYGQEMRHEVDDLKLYLEKMEERLSDLRK